MNQGQLNAMNSALADIATERRRQHAEHGEQELTFSHWEPCHHALFADDWKTWNSADERAGRLTWDGLIREELHEAFAETDLAAMRADLVQLAALVVQAIECIDRKAAP